MKRYGLFLLAAALLAAAGCAVPARDALSGPSAAALQTAPRTETPADSEAAQPDALPAAPEPAGQASSSTAEEIQNTLGLSFRLPEGARDVAYAIVELEGSRGIAQAKFLLDESKHWLRILPTDAFLDISGVEAEWQAMKTAEVGYCGGEVRFNEGERGVCLWYDIVPGLMYSLYVEEGANEKGLLRVAGEAFAPMQEHE